MSQTGWAPITQSLVDHDERALGSALRDGRVVLVMTDRGSSTPAVLTGADGIRSVIAFSSPESFDLWDRQEFVGLVPGGQTAAVASGQEVQAVLFDPAGPAPVSLPPAYLQEIIDGIVHDDGVAALMGGESLRLRPAPADQVRAVADAVAATGGQGLELYLVQRLAGTRWLATLAVYGPGPAVAALAGRLSAHPAPGLEVLDVVAVPDSVRAQLASALPQTRLDG